VTRTGIAPVTDTLPTEVSRAKAEAVHAYDLSEKIAFRIKDASALEKALIGKLEAERDFAQEYQIKFPHGGNRKGDQVATSGHLMRREEWCVAHGFAHRTVRRWLELVEEIKFIEKKNAILKKCWQLAELWQAANFMSDSVEWFTPALYLKAVRELLGQIDLDPASSAEANVTVGAKQYFTEHDDGLTKPWHGTFFMNPPYGKTPDGKSLAGAFCNKALAEYQSGKVSAGVILVNSLHSQAWQAPLYNYPICFVGHRIQFVSADGEENKNPTFQNIFIYLGNDLQKFAEIFKYFGYVMVPA
jgi:hypothetical protein